MLKMLSRYLCGLLVLSLTTLIQQPLDVRSEDREGGKAFVTWNVFEVDKCASIWLIKQFIEPNADIQIIAKGEMPKQGIRFDMPEANFKRTFNMSTYESLLHHYKLTDARLVKIGKIIHDVEINTWESKIYPESQSALEAIDTILMSTSDYREIIARSRLYFDALYQRITP